MTPENEIKKAYLNRYKWDLKALEEIEGEITACRLGALPGAISYTGMPHGSGNNTDLSDYAAKIDGLLQKLREKREETIRDLHEIMNAIDAVKDEESRVLLRYKYIQCKGWRGVAAAMNYSEPYVKSELHSKALHAFQLPTKTYEDL